MSYITDPKGSQFGLFSTYGVIDAQTMLGQRFHTEDGREVALVLNGGVALASGVLVQHSPIVPNHENLAVTAFSPVSAQTNQQATVTVTLGATLATAQQYQGGFAVVNAGTGKGQTLRIASNPAAALSSSMVITLEDAPLVALDTSSKIDLIAAPYSNVVINPTTATASPAGVTLYPLAATTGIPGTASYVPVYGFVQTGGIVSCLSDVSVAGVGLGIMPSTTTAGAITVATATGPRIGDAYQTSVSAENRAVRVSL